MVAVHEVIRGKVATFAGCDNVLQPAGLRGRITDAASGASLSGATVDTWVWPPPQSTGPFWAWPVAGGIPVIASTTAFQSLAFGHTGPNYGFDAVSGQCINGVQTLNLPPGWLRLRVQKADASPPLVGCDEIQGISPGWMDVYGSLTPGQFVPPRGRWGC